MWQLKAEPYVFLNRFGYALFLKILYENAANTYVGFKLFTG